MLDKFRENVSNKQFWNDCIVPYTGKGVLQYYCERFLNRVDVLANEKGISQGKRHSFARSLAVKKFKDSCVRYYDISSYSEQDIEDDGTHLMVVSECYEWIAQQLGIPKERLINIRLDVDEECVKRLFGEV